MDPKVDAYIARSKKWPAEMTAVRPILLSRGLDEAIKWGKPCFSSEGKNIAILQEMNDFLALMFFKGALMADPAGLLREQGPNSRSAKRLEFTSVDQVEDLVDVLADDLDEAIAIEKAGLTVEPAPEVVYGEELQARLDSDPALRAAFEGLTPGRRREYNMHFSDAKQAATREGRIDKCIPKIMAGKGFRE